jgi:hypothetical protein
LDYIIALSLGLPSLFVLGHGFIRACILCFRGDYFCGWTLLTLFCIMMFVVGFDDTLTLISIRALVASVFEDLHIWINGITSFISYYTCDEMIVLVSWGWSSLRWRFN